MSAAAWIAFSFGVGLAYNALSVVASLVFGAVVRRRDAFADDGQAHPDDWDRLVAEIAEEDDAEPPFDLDEDSELLAVAEAADVVVPSPAPGTRHLHVVPIPRPRRP